MRLRRSLGVFLIVLVLFAVIGALISLGVWIPNYPSTGKYPVRGVDVSHHQGTIDWSAVKTAGITFAYIKATEGTRYQDPAFVQNWSGAAGSGIVGGAYHFFTRDAPGEKQAENFLRVAPVDSNTLPPAIDLEFSGYNRHRRPSHS